MRHAIPSLTHIRHLMADIKIAHSIFALPFALMASFMAAAPQGTSLDWNRFAGQLVLIVLAMVFARTAAMLANRLLDMDIDAKNPRTQGRALPSGNLSPRQVFLTSMLAAGLFMGTCLLFGVFYDNWWPAMLGIPVLSWICAYAMVKRFSVLCHLYLGSSLAISPIAAAIAIQPDSIMSQPALWLLAGMVLGWVTGFDVIYALQDIEVDREEGLHSLPSKLGMTRALWISRLLHLFAIACLIGAWWVDARFETLFAIGIGIVTALLVYEHATVAKWGTTKMALAFFTLNGIISCVLGALGIADIVI
ncbi:MAG: putative 4-hydroxybenzoate polyprenyltransferase [Planctomycetota bacterium]|nr:putative 4-hydroxybenzoate polyprenyltransferase [Planctomycetota bacterium]